MASIRGLGGSIRNSLGSSANSSRRTARLRKRQSKKTNGVRPLSGRVEDGRGGCALKSSLRFPSPLIKPDVLISSIRLSDRRHRTTHGGRPLCARIRCGTASSPNTSPKENREVPRLLTLCRLQRKFRTRS
jgi:hypothetical protein